MIMLFAMGGGHKGLYSARYVIYSALVDYKVALRTCQMNQAFHLNNVKLSLLNT